MKFLIVHYSELQKVGSRRLSLEAPSLPGYWKQFPWLHGCCLFYPTASINVNFPAGTALFAFTVKTELTILVMLLKNICHVKKSCCL